MDMNHLLGQRFNLISKSDIRYVGTLHEINPELSTIALQDVISYGTEGRRGNPAEEIAPSSSVYDYIVFRGSDVKDISVVEEEKENTHPEPSQAPSEAPLNAPPSGPAPQSIPQSQQQQPPLPPQQPQQIPQGPHPTPPGYPQFQGYYPPYGQRYGGPPFPPGPGFPNMPYGAPPGWYPPPGQGFPQGPGQFPPHQIPIGPPGQPQNLPPQRTGPPNMPKPTSELPVADRPVSKPTSREATPAPATTAEGAPRPPVESKPTVAEAVKASTTTTEPGPSTFSKAPPPGPKGGRAPPVIPITTSAKPPIPAVANAPLAPAPMNSVTQGPAQAAITEATRAATAAVAAAMAKLPQPNGQKKSQYADASVEGVTKHMGELKPYDGNRAPRGGQHPRGRGSHRGHYQGQAKKVEVPTTDYDFETANAKFNKQELVKEAIATGSPLNETEPPVPLASSEPVETTSTSNVTAYNKATSFFDNISSEARDREEGTGPRAGGREWRGEEEKRNIETFGQGSVDGYRGGYRGRGRGRGYSRGRGGYSRGYNPRGRGGRNVSQSTGVPTPN